MERVKIDIDEKEVIASKVFVIDSIFPIIINKVEDNLYSILFFIAQDSTEDIAYVKVPIIAESEEDVKFIESNSLWQEKVINNEEQAKQYKEFTKYLRPDNIFTSDLSMLKDPNSLYFYSIGAMKLNNHMIKINFSVSGSCFVKLSLFFSKFLSHVAMAGVVFASKKLNNVSFVTMDWVKLDASSSDMNSNIVYSHYTAGRGPSIFKFNYINKKLNMKLFDPWFAVEYSRKFGDDFVILDAIYNDDILYLLYEERSLITDQFKCTKALVFKRELYEKTSFLNDAFIYRPDKKQ